MSENYWEHVRENSHPELTERTVNWVYDLVIRLGDDAKMPRLIWEGQRCNISEIETRSAIVDLERKNIIEPDSNWIYRPL